MKKKELIGIFRGNEKGFGFVKVEDQEKEIYIAKGNTYGAIDGDEVIVKIVEEQRENSHQEGKIVKILKHEKTKVVGVFQKSKNFGFVIPDDKKITTDIYISKKNSY